jgi:predicted AlkP superfamily phosphohydrolase/phosphomutase
MKTNRVFVFGIDGGTFDIILPAIRKGKLPNLQALMGEGSWGPLRSTIHPVTPMAWSSFATGVNPGKHSIFDFSRVEGRQIRLNTAYDRQSPAIWTYLSQAGRNSIVLNVPFTYPPEKIHGIMIPGFDAPRVEQEIFHPKSVYHELIEQFGDYQLDWTFPVGKKFDLEAYMSHVKDTIRHRAETSLYLLRNHPWDFFMLVFSSTDHVQHIFWRYPGGLELIEDTYQMVDKSLGEFLNHLPKEATKIIISDHGAGPIDRTVYLDNWLIREGYLKRRQVDVQGPIIKQIKHYFRLAVPTGLRKFLRSKLPYLRGRLEAAEHEAAVDWSRTQAYSYGMYGNIYLNVRGRDPKGILDIANYDSVRREISKRLLELVDPETGERVVERVYGKEELYTGPYTSLAPDLVVRWRDYAYFTKRGIDRGKSVFGRDLKVNASEFPHTGTHRLDGIFIASGPQIKKNPYIFSNIVDLAPTILYILGERVPPELDGRVINELFDEQPLQIPTVPVQMDDVTMPDTIKEESGVVREDEDLVKERLRSLGYID